MGEIEFYEKIKDWDFSNINRIEEKITDWDLYKLLNQYSNEESKILDLGTGGGEKVIKYFPNCKEIIATDLSQEMINTANKNLKESGRNSIIFKQMDNLYMDTPDDYFDIVVARNTCIDANQIYKTLKQGGRLLVHGVDKLDCWSLKESFGRGQGFLDEKPISKIDYENIINAGFNNVELVPIHVKEYYHTKDDLMALLYKTPIINNFSLNEKLDEEKIDTYISENKTEKGILLNREYYGISAIK